MVWCRHERPTLETARPLSPSGRIRAEMGMHLDPSLDQRANDRSTGVARGACNKSDGHLQFPNTVLIAPNRSSFITGDEDSADDYCTA